MTTSEHPHDEITTPRPAGSSAALRLRLSDSPGGAPLDGGWWPRSRDLNVELAQLVDGFPTAVGRIYRALYSKPDWTTHPRSVKVARGWVKTGSFPRDDTHLLVVSLSTHTVLRLLVVPPEHPRGQQAMGLASDPSNRWAARQILDSPMFDVDVEGMHSDHWDDDGGNWWTPGTRAPSFR